MVESFVGQGETDERQLDRVFRALADPSRRRIIALLREAGELRVGTLAEAFDMSLNGVSKHVKVLEKAGLIDRRIAGTTHFLRVHWSSLQAPYQWLHFHHHFWSQRIDALADYVTRNAAETDSAADPDGPSETS